MTFLVWCFLIKAILISVLFQKIWIFFKVFQPNCVFKAFRWKGEGVMVPITVNSYLTQLWVPVGHVTLGLLIPGWILGRCKIITQCPNQEHKRSVNSELQRCVCTCVSIGTWGVELRACSAKMWELLPFQTPAELLAESWGRSGSVHAGTCGDFLKFPWVWGTRKQQHWAPLITDPANSDMCSIFILIVISECSQKAFLFR